MLENDQFSPSGGMRPGEEINKFKAKLSKAKETLARIRDNNNKQASK